MHFAIHRLGGANVSSECPLFFCREVFFFFLDIHDSSKQFYTVKTGDLILFLATGTSLYSATNYILAFFSQHRLELHKTHRSSLWCDSVTL